MPRQKSYQLSRQNFYLERIKTKKIPLYKVSKELGISYTHLSTILNGINNCPVDLEARIDQAIAKLESEL
jgi:hypothetical protein